jgi:DNA repair exonuclease SbcCD ATPase subunit
MNSMEKSMLLDELFALRKADKEERDRLLEKLDRMTEQLMNLNESSQMQMKQNEELKQMIASRDILIEKLQKGNAALKEQKKQNRKNLYGAKSQKISRKKKRKHLLMQRIRMTLTELQDLHPSQQVTKMLFHKHRRKKREDPILS